MNKRKIGWIIMTGLALAVVLYAALVLLIPGFGPPYIAERRALMPLALSGHLLGGLSALALGPWQLNGRLRQRRLSTHRWMGRGYVVAVVIGGLGALGLATVSNEGLVMT